MVALSLSEVYSQLDKAILDITAKKSTLDSAIVNQEAAVEVVRKANADYTASIRYAQELRNQLTTSLDNSIPTEPQEKIRA